MPKLPCPCGVQINLSPIPNPYGFRIIPETLMEQIADSLIELHKTAKDDKEFAWHSISQFGHRTNPGVMHIYECKACGRIAVFAHESDNMPVIWYKPEKFTDREQGTSMNEIAVNLMNSDKSTE
jgi:hypothetical protein